jgi:hypothetical protein
MQVKSFSRSAAGQHTPHQDDLRPPAVLYKTVCHLLTKYVIAGLADTMLAMLQRFNTVMNNPASCSAQFESLLHTDVILRSSLLLQ